MSYQEQKKYFEILKKYERKFDPKEKEVYKILLQRHKDDEDLDKLSFEKLKNLYIKYHVNRERKNLDNLFKKPEDRTDE
ncbi:hypothetical protein [Melioribacter sp. OK-6-Me]|uniref:hypothetical protein n=1 Tax=unclassified Melioribacter TaxID=2627329 RepID=UPI003EDA4376